MTHFVMGLLEDLQEECQLDMLRNNMNISHLIVYAIKVEEERTNRKSKDSKRARSFDGGCSKNRLEIQTSKTLRRGFQIKSLSNSQELVVRGCLTVNSRGEKFGKNHYGDCPKGTGNCFSGGKSGQNMRDFPILMSQDKVSGQAQASGSGDAPNKNRFYALCSRGEQETSPDGVIGMLKVFSVDVYELILALLYHLLHP